MWLVPVHLSLLLSVAEVVLVLHTDEFCPTILFCDKLHTSKLIRPHGASANIADLSGLDEIVERFHRFFWRHRGVISMDLKKVNVFCAKPGE
jgi:hypothetical protein